MGDLKQERIRNYKKNLSYVKKINPMTVVHIESALDTLENEEPTNLNNKIDSVKAKVIIMNRKRDNEGEVRARARWKELNWIKKNLNK